MEIPVVGAVGWAGYSQFDPGVVTVRGQTRQGIEKARAAFENRRAITKAIGPGPGRAQECTDCQRRVPRRQSQVGEANPFDNERVHQYGMQTGENDVVQTGLAHEVDHVAVGVQIEPPAHLNANMLSNGLRIERGTTGGW